MSTTNLKLLALVAMLIDHIGEFIPSAPSWFRLVGRIAAPLFIFCMVWGFHYTHSRRKYLLRMYLFGVLMAFMNLYLNAHRLIHYNCYITNNIFPTLFSICIIIAITESIKNNSYMGKKYLIIFSIWQLISTTIIYFVDVTFLSTYIDPVILAPILGNIFLNEGGFPIILLGVLLYFCKSCKKSLIITYSLFCITYFSISFFSIIAHFMRGADCLLPDALYNAIYIVVSLLGFETIFITPISLEYFFEFHFQWAMLAALPFMLRYNNQKGKGLKYLFYLFYPLHILVLYYIGSLLV